MTLVLDTPTKVNLQVKSPPTAMGGQAAARSSGSDSPIESRDSLELAFVGREAELEWLADCLEDALTGNGRVCLVAGEAGSGKTALMGEFIRRTRSRMPDLVTATGTSSAQTGIGDPYLPFREVLADLVGASPVTEDRAATDGRLKSLTIRSIEVLVETAPELVGVLIPGATLLAHVGKAVAHQAGWMERLENLAEQEQRAARTGATLSQQDRIFEQYTALIREMSTVSPLLLFVDDLQWADTASIGLLYHLARNLEGSRVLLVGSYRPSDVALGRNGERHPLESVANEITRYFGDVTLSLDHQDAASSREFIDSLLDSEPNALSEEFRIQLHEKTAGHPLFTVELLRTLQLRGSLFWDPRRGWRTIEALDWATTPARVEGVIEERLGRLAPDLRRLLAAASVAGESFAAEVVARVAERPIRDTLRDLAALGREHRIVRPAGVIRHGDATFSMFRFAHNLFQHHMYASLAEAERAYLHLDVADATETIAPEPPPIFAADLGRHYAHAGANGKAASYYLKAGARARRMSAHREAAGHLDTGLALVASLPDSGVRTQIELNLLTLKGMELIATRGYGSPEVEAVFTRAAELAPKTEGVADDVPVRHGLCALYFMRGELQRAYDLATDLLDVTDACDCDPYSLGTRLIRGASALHLGQVDEGQLDLGIVAAEAPADDEDLAYLLGHDPTVAALGYLSLAAWNRGQFGTAESISERALRRARELDHPFTLAYALTFGALLGQRMRTWDTCIQLAEEAIEISRARRYPTWEALATITLGSVHAVRDGSEALLESMRQGSVLHEATGARISSTYIRTVMAEAYLATDRIEDGLEALTAPRAAADDIWWDAELHRLHGELLLARDGTASVQARDHLERAYDLAREEGAVAFQFRSAVSLARLLATRGELAEAVRTLRPVVIQAPDDGETPEAVAAEELLAELEWQLAQNSNAA